MNSLDQFFQNEIVHALGWTILHSLWQGLLVVLLLTIGLVVLRKASSRIRYQLGYMALLSLTLASVGTFCWYLSAGIPANSIHTIGGSSNELMIGLSEVASSSTMASGAIENNFWQSFVHLLESNLAWITIIWMLGVLILSLRLLAELAYVQRLKYQPGGLSMPVHQELLNKLAASMGIRQLVELKENIRINSPMVIGFIKPVILVPFGLLSNLDPVQVESILAHELAHIKRHDYIFNLLQSLVEIVLFFNPATWWISSLIRSEREHSCDERAIAETGNQLVFVQTLAKLEEYRNLPNSMALAFNGHRDAGVLGRIKRILNSEEHFRVPIKLFWSAMILLCSLGLFAFQDAPMDAQESPSPIDQSTYDKSIDSVEQVTPTIPEMLSQKNKASEKVQAKNPVQEKEENRPLTLTKEDVQRIPFRHTALSEKTDTVPPKIKQLRQEMMELAKTFQEQEMNIQKQSREIQLKKLELEMKIREMENVQLKKLYELQNNGQQTQLSGQIKLKELEIESSNMENEMLEIQYKMQQLDSKMAEEGQTEASRKQRTELENQHLQLQKKQRELELTQKRHQLAIEKEMQLTQNKQWKLQEEAKINQNNKQLEIMELEQRMQEIQFKNQMMQSELQNKMQLLEMQLQEALQKKEGRQEE